MMVVISISIIKSERYSGAEEAIMLTHGWSRTFLYGPYYKGINMIIKFSTKTLIPFLLLASCSSYEVSVNNQVLYTPPPLYSDYYIADPDLSHCVKSSIREKQIVKMEDLEELFCPPGDIQSLSGLETFKKLKKLGLGKNKINKLEGIQQLLELQHLDLSENNLVTVYELAHLKKLLYVDLRNNTLLDCSTFTSEVDASKIILPKHCK